MRETILGRLLHSLRSFHRHIIHRSHTPLIVFPDRDLTEEMFSGPFYFAMETAIVIDDWDWSLIINYVPKPVNATRAVLR